MNVKVSHFGKFKLLKQIARGGMAEIFLGCSGNVKSAHKFVVIKRILSVHSHNKEFNKMFQSEGKIAVNLNHSNICSIHEFGMEKNQYFICMEYISGRNIRQLLKKLKSQKKDLDPALCAHIMRNACNGLEYAHNCTDSITGQPLNIIHRDISPQNIMISFNGDVKVIDFGIAKIDDSESTKVGVLKGKFEYMSPEQVRGKDLDRQTDIFSLGNVLWEILAGKKLFTASNEIKLLKKIRDCQIPDLKKINPKVPDRLVEIVNKSLNPNKNLRYKTMAEMGNDISIFMNKFYPNFIQTSFSTFMKELYVEEILEERQSFKTYSQLLASNISQSKKQISSLSSNISDMSERSSTFIGYTQKTEASEEETREEDEPYTQTSSPTQSSAADLQYTMTQTEQTQDEPQSAYQEVTKTEFDDKLDDDPVLYKGRPFKNTASQNTVSQNSYQVKSDGYRNTISFGDEIPPETKETMITKSEIPKEGIELNNAPSIKSYTPWKQGRSSTNYKAVIRKKKRKTFVRRAILGLFISGIIGGAYVFQSDNKNQATNSDQEIDATTPSAPTSQLPNQPGKALEETILDKAPERKPTAIAKPASIQKALPKPAIVNTIIPKQSIFITTKPSGAQLYINNTKVEYLTPTSIIVPSKKFQLLIKRMDYYDHTTVLSPGSIKNKMHFVLKKKQVKKRKRNTVIIRQ